MTPTPTNRPRPLPRPVADRALEFGLAVITICAALGLCVWLARGVR